MELCLQVPSWPPLGHHLFEINPLIYQILSNTHVLSNQISFGWKIFANERFFFHFRPYPINGSVILHLILSLFRHIDTCAFLPISISQSSSKRVQPTRITRIKKMRNTSQPDRPRTFSSYILMCVPLLYPLIKTFLTSLVKIHPSPLQSSLISLLPNRNLFVLLSLLYVLIEAKLHYRKHAHSKIVYY